ncbi:MAG: HlyD family efflux transporter periplasmic adaptor subunit, partial [Chloroflexota bacterium]|nr:HlyD family efflux transporter periplasmic adaptor subunit [Chloroflexota bacterium]
RHLLLTALLILATGCSASPSGGAGGPTPTPIPPAPEAEQPTYTVQRGTVTRSFEFTARVAPVQQADLFFHADGHLARLLVQRDERVHEGDLLAELEMADLQRQLEVAQLDWQQAQIESSREFSQTQLALQDAQLALDRARATYPDPAVLKAQVELTRSQEALARAQEAYDKTWDPARDWELQVNWRAEQLKAERESTERALKEAQRDLEIAQADYDDAVKGRYYTIRELENGMAQVQLEYDTALAGPDPRLEQKVRQLEAQVAEHQIVAPFDGVVLAISAAPGESVSAYQTVLVAGDPSELELRADLSADDVRDLAVGQEATLAPADYPGQTFQGRVRQLPYGWDGDVEETDRATHVALGSDAPDLEVGALVRVTIVLEKKDGVLWLSPAVLQTFRGRTFVIVQEPDGTQRTVDVVTGIESDERVEIVSGLEEGQVVVGP